MSTVSVRRPILIETFSLTAWIVLCSLAAVVGSVAVGQTIDSWYVALQKPAWNPPNWLFGPVWTTLYLLMAISAWLIWRRRDAEPSKTRVALGLFLFQLVLNAAWSWIFFGWMLPGAAFVEIVVLWLAILGTIVADWPISRVAAVLLVPYLAWVTFASVLNGVIWGLN